jgi:hypothetical protein
VAGPDSWLIEAACNHCTARIRRTGAGEYDAVTACQDDLADHHDQQHPGCTARDFTRSTA